MPLETGAGDLAAHPAPRQIPHTAGDDEVAGVTDIATSDRPCDRCRASEPPQACTQAYHNEILAVDSGMRGSAESSKTVLRSLIRIVERTDDASRRL